MEQTMFQNRYVQAVLVLLSLFLLIAAVGSGVKTYKDLSDTSDKHVLNISAIGEVKAKPDVAEASFGVLTEGSDPQKIQDENSTKVNKITAFLKDNGIEEGDITTANYNLYPRYSWPNGKQVLDGYTLTQTVNVKIKNLDKVGDILKGVVQNGANNINGLTYKIDDPESLKQEARKLALNNAKSKADDLAKVAGVKLGKVIDFSESTTVPSGQYPYDNSYGVGGGGGAGGGPAPEVQSGSTTVTASVSVTFELK